MHQHHTMAIRHTLEDPADAAKPSMVAPHDGTGAFASCILLTPRLSSDAPPLSAFERAFWWMLLQSKGGKPGIFGREVVSRTRSFLLRGLRICLETLHHRDTMSPPQLLQGQKRLWATRMGVEGWIHVQVHALASHSLHFALMSSFFIHTYDSIHS